MVLVFDMENRVFSSRSVFLIVVALWPTTHALSQVSGTIRDAHTDLPVAGAQLEFVAILANPIYATTYPDGTYSVSLPEGTYTVYITKDGYANNSLNNVQVASSATTAVQQDGVLTTNVVYPWPFVVPPTLFRTMQDKVQYFQKSSGYGWYSPDGKTTAFRSDPKNKTAPFIIHIAHDYRMTSTNSFFNNVTGPAGSLAKDYVDGTQHSNYVTLPNTIPIPPPNVTGLRGDGTYYDFSSAWLFNAFRLAETSDPSANPDRMIGFVHNEDYWGNPWAVDECTYKSVGVRYSDDLGLSWTRSVPILTRLIQPQTHEECKAHTWQMGPSAGTGDMAAMWNPIKSQWVMFAQEGQFGGMYAPSPALVMSVSSDPLARPGTWTRIDPTTNRTDPGFIGSLNRTLGHGDLVSIQGASPSIIRDSKHNVWHMVWAHWGGGLAYVNSTDLMRWTKPTYLALTNQGSGYPTLIGDEGDTLTTTGEAWLWMKGNNRLDNNGYNSVYGAKLNFASSQ